MRRSLSGLAPAPAACGVEAAGVPPADAARTGASHGAADGHRGEAGGHPAGRAGAPRAATGTAEEDLVEIVGEIDRLDVLDVVDEQLGHALVAGAIEAAQPVFGLAQVFGLRRHRHDRIRALDRQETEHAGQRRFAGRAEHLLEFRQQGGDIGALQGEHADRHALHPVDVEHVDGLRIVLQFGRRAGHHDHAAGGVGIDHGFRLGVRLEQLGHLGRRHVAQREHAHFVAAGEVRRGHARDQVARHRVLDLQDDVAAVLVDEGVAGPRQQHLEDAHRLVGADRFRGRERHVAADVRRDRVVLLQEIAEDRLDHGLDRIVLEVEIDLTVAAGRGECLAGRRLVDEPSGADLDLRLGCLHQAVVATADVDALPACILGRAWRRLRGEVVGRQRLVGDVGGRRLHRARRAAGQQRDRRDQGETRESGWHGALRHCLLCSLF